MIANVPGRLGFVADERRARRGLRCRGSGGSSKAALLIPKVRYWEKQFLGQSDDAMLDKSMELRGKARGKWDLDKLLPEAFGLVSRGHPARRSASGRSTCSSPPGRSCTSAGWPNWRPAKARRVTASLPAFLNALVGKGVHVTTVNDYLAKRDAEWIGPVYQKLGLTVGCLQQKMDDADRIAAYQPRHHLRHRHRVRLRLPPRPAEAPRRAGAAPRRSGPPWMPAAAPAKLDPRVQRALHFAIVDEADSIFIDEARTPLIIANPTRPAEPEEQVVYHWADQRRPSR